MYLVKAIINPNDVKSKIQDLEKMVFGVLFTIFFTDNDFIKSCKTNINKKSWNFKKNEVIDNINNLSENILFDNYLKKIVFLILRIILLKLKIIGMMLCMLII